VRGLRDRVGLVTGAAQGIGRGIALRFAEEGMAVALVDINRQAVEEAAHDIADATGARTLALALDVADESAVPAAIAAACATLGGLHVLVNNAGVDISCAPERLSRTTWNKVHDVSLWAPMLMVREALPALTQASGAIVNIASTHAFVTEAGRAAYAAAKAGATGLTRALALDLGPRGIRVNTVLPGYVRTPIWRLWLDAAPDPDVLVANIGARHPVGRVGEPADVAGLVAFLCSDDASFITGAEFLIDGGYTIKAHSPSA
jgi:NAD(P)-dependent dehydrogenase (short-subunit alcohol dehydrogenase family)